jgi:hypothetical protein
MFLNTSTQQRHPSKLGLVKNLIRLMLGGPIQTQPVNAGGKRKEPESQEPNPDKRARTTKADNFEDLSVFMTPYGNLPDDPEDWVFPSLLWPVPDKPPA